MSSPTGHHLALTLAKSTSSQRELLSLTLESIGVGVVVADENGRFLIYNRMAEEITGVAQKEQDPDHWQETFGLYHEDETTPFATEDVPLFRAIGGETVRDEKMFLRHSALDRGRHLSVTATPLRDDHGNLVGGVCVFEDVTKRKLEAIGIGRVERLAALGTMAAGLAHEINNPLMAAWSSAEAARNVLAATGPNIERLTACLDNLTTSIQRAGRIVENFLAFAKGQPLHRSVDDFNEAVRSAIAMVRNGEGGPSDVPIEFQFEQRIEHAIFDRLQLQQIVINLVQNAIEAASPTVTIRTARRAEIVILTIEDRGVGMTAEQRSRAFDPFYTSRPDGTGIGLTIVHRIVEDHGGTIHIESTPDRGTSVSVHLPAVDDVVSTAAPDREA